MNIYTKYTFSAKFLNDIEKEICVKCPNTYSSKDVWRIALDESIKAALDNASCLVSLLLIDKVTLQYEYEVIVR